MVQLKYAIIGSDPSLVPIRRQAIIWINDGLVDQRIYTPLGLNELIESNRKTAHGH